MNQCHAPRRLLERGVCTFILAAVAVLAAAPVAAWQIQTAVQQPPFAEHRIFDGRSYDPAVPAPTAALGYSLGQHLATYAELLPYLERLAASSARVRVERHGESYEGRPIVHLIISAPENLARLDDIRADLARLADPGTVGGSDALEALIRRTPVAVMLVFATDGAETAGPESALQVAYQLAAANDQATEALLRDVVVIIVPAQNPDSNQRVVAWDNAFRVGPAGTADRFAAEHRRPWGMNSNNRYQIDMNRESVWSTQRETRAMVALYRRWNPQVFVDNHGEYPIYTGPPYAEPLHEVLTSPQRDWLEHFGTAIGRAFDAHGYDYSPWGYGQFDPGYWDTYPNFSGAVAWTTETTGGGARGLRYETDAGVMHTLRDGIIQHMIASDVTVRTAAANRERLLRAFHAYKESAIEEGRQGRVRGYALSADNDPHRLQAVVNALRRNRIEVHRTTIETPITGARAYFQTTAPSAASSAPAVLPAGSYVLPLAQPEGRMLRVLMEREARFSSEFLEQVEQTRAAAEEGGSTARVFYDITAWAMPFTYHLAAYELPELPAAAGLALVQHDVTTTGEVVNGAAGHALLIDYASNGALRAIARLHAEGVRYRVAAEPFDIDGERFGTGTLVILLAENPDHEPGRLASILAADAGVRVVGVDSPRTRSGPPLDEERLVPAAAPSIAVIMGRPTSASSYGHIWYTLERIYGFDFTALDFDRLLHVDLEPYDVLILPDGNYGSVHGAVAADVAARLREWTEGGGTLIGIRGASAWLAAEPLDITRARLRSGAAGRDVQQPVVPGTIFRATVTEPRSPLVYGYEGPELPVMVWSELAFEPTSVVEAPVRLSFGPDARLSGFAFPESLQLLGGSPYLMRERRGDGAVVLFLDDPLFRLFWDGLSRMFFNAVLYGVH